MKLLSSLCPMIFCISAASLLCDNTLAQEVERSFVTSTGKATVYTAPTHAVFWLHRVIKAERVNQALEESTKVDSAIRDGLTQMELHPTLIETSTPAIVSAKDSTVRVSTEVRFSMGPYLAGESNLIRFGELCEQLKEVAAGLGAELSEPGFMTTEKRTVTQEAVQEAAKQAFPAAKGAAEALGISVQTVDTMEVGAITWNTPPDTEAVYPTVLQLACTAEVKVTYILE